MLVCPRPNLARLGHADANGDAHAHGHTDANGDANAGRSDAHADVVPGLHETRLPVGLGSDCSDAVASGGRR